MNPAAFVVIAALGLSSAACVDSSTNAGSRYETNRTTGGTMKQTPASQSTASSSTGKGRAGEHKSMMRHH